MRKKKMRSQDKIVNVMFHIIAIVMIILVIYPLWFVILASFSNPADVANGEVWLLPKKWDISGYQALFAQKQIWTSYRNTIAYTVVGTLIALGVNIPAGYAMSRNALLGKKWINIF